MSYNYQDLPGCQKAIQDFVSEEGISKRELYFYPDELPFPIPEGKVVRITIDYVALAKLENRPE
jgi:hypothetical protein